MTLTFNVENLKRDKKEKATGFKQSNNPLWRKIS